MTDIELKTEYKERLREQFKKINPYTYGTKTWDAIQEKVKELEQKIDEIPYTELKEIRIDGEDYLLEFEEFVKKQPKLSVKLSSREEVLRKLRELNDRVVSVSSSVWKQIRFIFSIPALAFASFVFSYVIILLFSIPLNWIFPAGFSEEYSGLTESILAAIIFVILKVMLTLDVHDRYLEENWIVYLIKYVGSICVWWTMFYLIRFTVYETIYQFNYVQWAFYLPFLWLGGIFHEFFRLGIIGFIITTTLPILISLPIILRREFGIKKVKNANEEFFKDNDAVEDDSYNFHFNEDINLEVLGQNNNQNQKDITNSNE